MDYITHEEDFDDNAQLVINPADGKVSIEDGDGDIIDDFDQYDIFDMVRSSADGSWIPDDVAIDSVAGEYI